MFSSGKEMIKADSKKMEFQIYFSGRREKITQKEGLRSCWSNGQSSIIIYIET
jgi:hypothetical protein